RIDPSAFYTRLLEDSRGRSLRLNQRHGVNFGTVGDVNRKDQAPFWCTSGYNLPYSCEPTCQNEPEDRKGFQSGLDSDPSCGQGGMREGDVKSGSARKRLQTTLDAGEGRGYTPRVHRFS